MVEYPHTFGKALLYLCSRVYNKEGECHLLGRAVVRVKARSVIFTMCGNSQSTLGAQQVLTRATVLPMYCTSKSSFIAPTPKRE